MKTWLTLFVLLTLVGCSKNKTGDNSSSSSSPLTDGSDLQVEYTAEIRFKGDKIVFQEDFRESRRTTYNNETVNCRISARAGQDLQFQLHGDELDTWERGERFTYTRASQGVGIAGVWVNNRMIGDMHMTKTLNFLSPRRLKISAHCFI